MLFTPPPFIGASRPPPEFVAAATQRGATGTSTNITIAKPTGTVEGDLMLAWLGNTGAQTITGVPSGWTLVAGPSASIPWYLYAKVAGSSEPSNYTFTWSSSTGNKRGTIVTYRGGYASVDVAGSFGSSSTATATAPSIDATAAGTLLAFYGLTLSSTTSISTPPSGMTERSAVVGGTGASPGAVIYDLTPSAAGSTGNKVLVFSAAQNNRSLLVQIR